MSKLKGKHKNSTSNFSSPLRRDVSSALNTLVSDSYQVGNSPTQPQFSHSGNIWYDTIV